MNDIEGALAAEQAYLADNSTPLAERLQPYGYDDLAQYFSDKRDYKVRHARVKVYEPGMDGISEKVAASFSSGECCVYTPFADDLYAWHGSEELNVEKCAELGVVVHDMGYIGGTIVGGPEDLSVAVLLPESSDVDTGYFMNKFAGMIGRYYADVTQDSNDILVDGKKVLGAMQKRENGVYMFACQLSFADRSALVEQLCPHNTGKPPSCISGGLTRDMARAEVLSWLS